LYNLIIGTQYELRVGPDHEGSLESPFMREYKYYGQLTESWSDSTTLVLNPYTFEEEVKNNFLIANDAQRTNYIKLLKSKVLRLTEPIAHVEKYLAILEEDIKSGKIDSSTLIDDSYDNYSYVSSFTYAVHMTLVDIEKVINTIEDNIKIFDSQSDLEPKHSEPTEPGAKLTWTCNPATAGFIIAQLVRNGFIEPPAKNGNLNYAELGRICSQIFDFKDNNPTPESWRKVLNIDASGGNQLSRINRAKFTFPYKDDLAN
jgi:hypothetical protein